jgi:hypothetical protein
MLRWFNGARPESTNASRQTGTSMATAMRKVSVNQHRTFARVQHGPQFQPNNPKPPTAMTANTISVGCATESSPLNRPVRCSKKNRKCRASLL